MVEKIMIFFHLFEPTLKFVCINATRHGLKSHNIFKSIDFSMSTAFDITDGLGT